MKKTMLCSALCMLIGSAQADTNPATAQPVAQQPTVNPAVTEPIKAMQQAPAVINCDYKIPAETKNIEQSLVMNWAKKAVVQSFDFNPDAIDSQVQQLKSCFTDQGWQGFNAALQKSGNIDAIKSQKLKVTSQVDGEAKIIQAKDNQWEINIPLQVIYQNSKEKVTQLLEVNLSVGRKITGDLGVDKLVATSRKEVTASIPTQSQTQPKPTTLPTQPSDSPSEKPQK